MNSRERVIKTYNLQLPDRVPIDFCADNLVYNSLMEKVGVRSQLELMEHLHIDFRWAKPKWIGPELKTHDGIKTDFLGIPREGVCFGFAVRNPLADIETIKDVEDYNWPLPEYWDYDIYVEEAKRFWEEGYAVYGGQESWLLIAACDLVGFEKFMMLMINNPELANKVLEKLTDFFIGCSKIMFEKGKGYVNIFLNGDDFGHQHGPLISLALWKRLVKPHIKRIFAVAKEYGLLITHHSCGSISLFLDDLIEIGLDAIEPIQVSAYNMDFESLVKRFKGRVVLHGSIDTQKTLPFGTVDDVRQEVISRIRLFKDQGGFVIGPSQHLLTEIPLDNILTMYQTAYEFGVIN